MALHNSIKPQIFFEQYYTLGFVGKTDISPGCHISAERHKRRNTGSYEITERESLPAMITWDSYGARSEWSSSKLGMPLNGAIAEVVLTVLCAGYCSKGCGPLWTAWEDLQDSSVASAWAGRACRSCPGLPDQGHTAPERVAAESQVLDTPHSASWGPVEAARGQKVLTLHLSEGPHRAKAGPQRLAIRLIPVSCSLG